MTLSAEKLKFISSYLGTNDFNIIPLAGDASSRRYFRLVHGESSLVIMDWDPFDKNQPFPFLSTQELFHSYKIKVPQIHTYDHTLGTFILEDLGDLTLERKFWESQNHENSIEYYKQTLDELIKIHSIPTQQTDKQWTALNNRFNTEKLLWELNYTKEHLVEKFLGLSITHEIAKEFHWLAETLAEIDPVICHRDYHSRNVMIKFGNVRIIDFQDARLGPRQYDIVSLLNDSYVDMNAKMQSELLNYYLKKSDIKNNKVLETFEPMLKLQFIQRGFKACGSFASFYNNRKDTRYLKYISPTIKKVVSATAQVPELKNLFEFLNKNKFQEKDYINHAQSNPNSR